MALTRTTINGAITGNDTTIRVASATGFTKGSYLRIDNELLLQTGEASGTVIPVRRGQNGTAAVAHVTGAGVVVGLASDFPEPAAGSASPVTLPTQPNRMLTSYSASGAITLPDAGSDVVAILNGTSVLAMTVAAPTAEMDGCCLYIAGNGVAAHTVTFTGGLSGASTNYDVITVNASAPVLLGPFMAVNSLWQAAVTVPMAGTVTNITASLT